MTPPTVGISWLNGNKAAVATSWPLYGHRWPLLHLAARALVSHKIAEISNKWRNRNWMLKHNRRILRHRWAKLNWGGQTDGQTRTKDRQTDRPTRHMQARIHCILPIYISTDTSKLPSKYTSVNPSVHPIAYLRINRLILRYIYQSILPSSLPPSIHPSIHPSTIYI